MITLRAVEPEDADFMYESENDVDAWRYSDYIAPLSREMLRQYAFTYEADPFASGQLRLVIDKDGNAVGLADLFEISPRHQRAESGIYIVPSMRSNGVGSEALKLLCEYSASRLGLHLLTAKIAIGNEAAAHAFANAGFSITGIIPGWLKTGNVYSDINILSKILN